MKKVFDKVNECLEKYIGGEIFFDELDKMVKFDKEVLKEFISRVQIGKLIDEDSYSKNEKHVMIDYVVNIDMIKDWLPAVV